MRYAIGIVAWLGLVVPAMAGVQNREWTVDGVKRTGIVYTPDDATKKPAAGWPVVFIFHGHGGNGKFAQRMYAVESHWPGAIAIYLDGLPTATPLVDLQGKLPGWDMKRPAETNKDIKLYDAVRADVIAKDAGDTKHVFVCGHSNGGGFVYTLWALRGDTLAAVAPSSATLTQLPAKYVAKPALISAGRNDPLVKFAWQDKAIDFVKNLNGVSGDGKPDGKDGVRYDSKTGTPLVTIIYDGGHAPPKDLGERVARFFQTVSQ